MKLTIVVILLLLLFGCSVSNDTYVDLSDVSLNYSLQSDFDLIVQNLPTKIEVLSIGKEDIHINKSYYFHGSNQLKFLSSYLRTLTLGKHHFICETIRGSFEVEINIINTDRPYLITNSTHITDFRKDLEFSFELFGGSIESLSGHDISSTQYVIAGSRITISKSFIQQQFNDNPALETIVLGYTLRSGTNIVVGYIFISQQDTNTQV